MGTKEALQESIEASTEEPVKKKTAAKKKSKKKTTKKVDEHQSVDPILSAADFVEKIKDAESALGAMAVALEDASKNVFTMGGLLQRIKENEWFGAYPDFKSLVESEYGMKQRKALYYINIYNTILDSKVLWKDVSGLGWTKLSLVAGFLNPETVESYVDMFSKMTVLQIKEWIKAQNENGEDAGGSDPSDVSTLTFKVYSDQKQLIMATLDAAKEAQGIEHDNLALLFLCNHWSSGDTAPVEKAEEAEDSGKMIEATPKALTEMLAMLPFNDVVQSLDAAFGHAWDITFKEITSDEAE